MDIRQIWTDARRAARVAARIADHRCEGKLYMAEVAEIAAQAVIQVAIQGDPRRNRKVNAVRRAAATVVRCGSRSTWAVAEDLARAVAESVAWGWNLEVYRAETPAFAYIRAQVEGNGWDVQKTPAVLVVSRWRGPRRGAPIRARVGADQTPWPAFHRPGGYVPLPKAPGEAVSPMGAYVVAGY